MNQELIKQVLGQWYVSNKKYHSPLPQDLAPFYCYTSDGGHNILCVLKQHYKPNADLSDQLVPVPVKTVLRNYEIKTDYVVVDCKYSTELGLIFDSKDEEF